MKRFLFFVLLLCSSAAFAQSAGPTNLTGSQCLSTNIFVSTPIVITVTGSWSGILQPQVLGQIGQNVTVTPIGISTPQPNIRANGIFTTTISGPNAFQVCAQSISGTATVTFAPPAQTSTAGNLTGSQCLALDVYIPGLASVVVTGNWSGQLQPQVYVAPPLNGTVNLIGVTTPQSTILNNGTYTTYVTVPNVWQLCAEGITGTASLTMTSAVTASSGGGGGGGVNPGSAAQQAIYTTTGSTVSGQPKLAVDMRDGVNGGPGVACNGSTDDTAALQAYFNYYGNGGTGAANNVQLQLPVGHCKISNQLVYEGNNSLGIRLVGQKGFNGKGTTLDWYGPNFGTMMLILGCNGCSVEEIDFNPSLPSQHGINQGAQNAVWWEASNTVTQAAYSIAAISRSGNVVTATTTGAHAVTAGRIVKVAGSTGGATSFNGTFQVQYANDNTHISWFQTGANESGTASTGTVTNYKSTPSNNVKMNHVEVIGPESVSSTINTIGAGSSPYTLTTLTPHFAFIGDTIIINGGGSDTSYNCAYIATGIPTSTTITAVVLPATGCAPSGSGSTGGTLTSGSSGIRIAHRDATTEQVSGVHFTDIFVQGDQLGGSVNCFESDSGGNVKGFEFENMQTNGCRFGMNGFASGQFVVTNYQGGLNTPDTTPQLAAIDFVNNAGQIVIKGAESEGSNYRFFVSSASPGGANIQLEGISWQGTAPTDDVVINFGSALTIGGGSLFINNRAAGSVPFIQMGNPLFGTLTQSLISTGNTYTNTATGCAGPSCGYIPVKDGSGNIFHATAGSFYDGKNTNIISIGDHGTLTATTGNTEPLNPVQPGFSTGAPIILGTTSSNAQATNNMWLGNDGSTQLAFGAPVSISQYIGNVGDNTSYLVRLTASLEAFNVPVRVGRLYSVAGTPLPTCNSSLQGAQATVSDATTPTYMGAYTGGGGVTTAVICSYNGSSYSWLTH